jgi:hypothetical protein
VRMQDQQKSTYVHFLLERYKLSAIDSTVLLYNVLVRAGKANNAVAAEIIKCLVILIKHDRNGLLLVQQQFTTYLVLKDANFYDGDANARGHMIEQYLLLRPDIVPTAQMQKLWSICRHLYASTTHKTVVTLERMCDVCINPYLISELVQLPDVVDRVVKEHAQRMTHVASYAFYSK